MSLNATDSSNAKTTTWLTPLWIIEQLGPFDLDPCGHPGHPTAKRMICLPENGLEVPWGNIGKNMERVWLNPPYGKEAVKWVQRLQKHGNGIALVFARLETQWIQPFIKDGFFQIEGRISFLNPQGQEVDRAGAGSILIPFGRKNIGRILMSDIPGRWFQ